MSAPPTPPPRSARAVLRDGARELLAIRWVRWATLLLVLALAGRLALESVLAAVLDRLAAQRDLACQWEDLDLSLLSGRGEVRFLEVRPSTGAEEPAAEPILLVEYGVFDLDVLALLTGELRVARAEVDGMDSRWIRDADGRWNLEQHVNATELLALLEAPPAEDEPVAVEPAPAAHDLLPPLRVDALRLQHARFLVVDRAAETPRELALEVSGSLSNLGNPARPTRFSATVLGGDLLDAAHLEGQADWSSDALALTLRAQAGSIRLAALAPYLEALDVRVASEALEARLLADLELRVIGEQRDGLSARAKLHDVFLRADGGESLALDRFEVVLDSLTSEGALLPGIEIEGVRGRASLQADALRVAGLDVTGTRWLDSIQELQAALGTEEERTNAVPLWLSLLFEGDQGAYPWRLGSLSVRDGLLDFTDTTTEPPAEVVLHLDAFEIGAVEHVPGTRARKIPVRASLRAPGLADSLELSGSFGPFAPERSVDLTLRMQGIGLESLDGYMQDAGVERALQRGAFHARLVGEARTDDLGRTLGRLAVEEVALEDSGRLFGIQGIRAEELLFDPGEDLLRFGNVEISGTQLAFGRDASSRFFALGLRTLGLAPRASQGSSGDTREDATTASPQDAALELPRIELARLAWVDSDVEFVDLAADPPRRVRLDQLGFELTDLSLGGTPGGPAPPPAHLTAHLVAPELVEELTLEGTVLSKPGPIDLTVQLALRGTGATGALAAPYLRALGVEPALDDARLSLDLEARIAGDAGTWHADLVARDALLADGGDPLVACDELRLEDARLGDTVEVGALTLTRPVAHLRREDGGALVVAGVRLLAGEAPPPASGAEAAPPQLSLPSLPALALGSLRVEDARLRWTDAALAPAIETELALDLVAGGLSTRGAPGTFEAELALAGALERLTVAGELRLDPGALALTAEVRGEGVRIGPLAPLLPPGVAVESVDGRLAARLAARVAAAPAGGLTLDLTASDLSWGEHGTTPWLALERGRLGVPRLDPAEGVLVLGPLTASGLSLEGHRDGRGGLHVLGAVLAAAQGAPAPRAADGTREADTADPAEASPPAVARVPFARIELVEGVRLEGARVRARAEGLGSGATPLELGATFELETPALLLDPDPEALTPLRYRLEGTMPGLVEAWSATGELSPFAPEPALTARLAASGIRTAGLVERVPRLAGLLEGTVEAGTFEASVTGTLFVRRVRANELGLSRPFGAELTLADVAYRAAPDGELLAGVDAVQLEVERVDAARGLVHVGTLEVLNPRGRLQRRDRELAALGFALHLDGAPPAQVGEPGFEPSVPEPPLPDPSVPVTASAPAAEARGAATEVPAEPVEPGQPGGELRVDQLLVSGIEFDLVDATPAEPVLVPLRALDVEVSRFTTRALLETLPVRFSAVLEPDHEESPPAFEEANATGSVALYPEPSGWIQLALTGLELPRFAPLAAMQDLDVQDGSMDASLRVRLKGQRGASVDSTLTFTDLDLDEPDGGLLERTLSLPMALDSALFLLKDADGEHRFSAGFHLDEGGLGGGQIALAAARAFTEVLARALAAVPLRLLGGLLPGGEPQQEARRTWEVPFAAGSGELSATARAALDEAVRRMAASRAFKLALRHELSAADAARAEVLANPSEEACLALVAGLRQRKAELLRTRAEVAKEAHVLHAIGDARARSTSDELRAYERELATIEDGLDHLLEILRSDSPRKRHKRTRSTAREIAQGRLDAVQAELQAALPRSAHGRIEQRAPRFRIVPGDGPGRVVVELRRR